MTCAFGPDGNRWATLVFYSNDASDADFRDELARQLNAYWDQTK